MGDWYPADEYAIPDGIEQQDIVYRREWDAKAGKYKDIVEKGVSRRYSDSRIWHDMSGSHERAAEWIEAAHRMMGIRRQGARIARYGDVTGGGQYDPEIYEDRYTRIVGAYNEWCILCKKYRADREMAVKVICEGWTLRRVDRYRRQRHGTGKKKLAEAMDLFCEVMGWK